MSELYESTTEKEFKGSSIYLGSNQTEVTALSDSLSEPSTFSRFCLSDFALELFFFASGKKKEIVNKNPTSLQVKSGS